MGVDISVTADKPVECDEESSRSLGAVRLLVVDDHASVGKLLRAIFDRDGWEVANATTYRAPPGSST